MGYLEITGKTESEAIEKALQQLGLHREDVSVEILERAKSGFLGFGSTPAKVRVHYEEAEPQPVNEEPSFAAPAKEPEVSTNKTEIVENPAPQTEAAEDEATDETAEKIRTFLSGLIAHMESNATVKVYHGEKDRYMVYLEGEKLGQLIGRRGETLDAMQQITSYAVNRGTDKRVRISLDAENYRAKREQSLIHLAEKVAGKVVKYRKNMTLEPMNAYERHVIHTALQDMPNVTTYSTGTEPNRRVVVAYQR